MSIVTDKRYRVNNLLMEIRNSEISRGLIIIVSVISCAGLSIISLEISAGVAQPDLGKFRSDLISIIAKSTNLTTSYNDEVGKWLLKQHDNSTMISITDSFLPKFEALVKSAENVSYPTDSKYVYDALVNSLKSETESYKHFRNYLISGNSTENETSTDLLSDAYRYEQIYSKFLSQP
jgi:hypothetical protein